MEKIIIYGGSFDPIHNGHLRLARAASLRLNADVVFVPAKDPRWKKPEASALDRVNMLHLALDHDGSGGFSLDLCEMTRPGNITYSIDTVKEFTKRYPNREFYWLIGADEVNKFPKWKSPDEMASLVHLIYIPRPGVEVDPAILRNMGLRNWITKALARLEQRRSGAQIDRRPLKRPRLHREERSLLHEEDRDLYQRPSARPFALGGAPGLRDRPTE
jgi:nicotinate-nucleotide adenylyltransferase